MSRFDAELLRSKLSEDAAVAGIAVSAAQLNSLVDYLGLLSKWNGVYNLTAIRDPEQMRVQHILDSLVILPYLDAAGVRSVIDVGTGGGLPGVVIAIMRPDWQVTLNDIVHKKTAFLTQAKGSLHLQNLSIHTGRVEEIPASAGTFDAVVSRAFADLTDFVERARHLVSAGGALYAMKGQRPDEELQRFNQSVYAQNATVEQLVELNVPKLDAARHLLILKFAQENDGSVAP